MTVRNTQSFVEVLRTDADAAPITMRVSQTFVEVLISDVPPIIPDVRRMTVIVQI